MAGTSSGSRIDFSWTPSIAVNCFAKAYLLFPTLPRLKTYFMEEYHRRIRAGLMPVTEERFKPIAPQLIQEQQAYKDELLENIKELRNKLGIVKKQVNTAMKRGDAQTVNIPEIMAETLCSLLRFVIGINRRRLLRTPPKPPIGIQ